MNEETCSNDVEGFTKPLGIDKRPTFKQFLNKKRKGKNVLQKQKNRKSSRTDI